MGWITKNESDSFQHYTIGIPGLGGVGGRYLLDLARLGFTNFVISDPDTFDATNINRQVCAYPANIGKQKNIVLTARVLRINPKAKITIIDELTHENVEEFVERCDIILDGLDLFAMSIRKSLFDECFRKKRDIITTAPLGFGASIALFPYSRGWTPVFDEYFGIETGNEDDAVHRFLAGMAPACLQRKYFRKSDAEIDIENKIVPSTVVGMEMAAALTLANVVKLLRNEPVKGVPYVHHMDAYRLKMKTTKRKKSNFFRKILLTRLKAVLK
jgi:molybdopterin/thiamine biosynthesis adenylyltransferase